MRTDEWRDVALFLWHGAYATGPDSRSPDVGKPAPQGNPSPIFFLAPAYPSDMPSQQRRPIRVVSDVLADGTLLESVQPEAQTPTSLVIARGNEIEAHSKWTHEDSDFVPVPAAHNLIKHRAIKLPGLPMEYRSAEKLASKIERYASRYLALSPEFLKIAATYVLLSWVYDAFNELPYLRFRGDYGSGKSRALTVFGSILYKGFFASGASTVSPIFHTLDTFRGALILDEADFRFTDEKAELVKILNNGNVKGFPVLRTHVTAAKEFEPRAFSVYGPKIVGMRGSYDDRALESRFLTEEMSGRALPAGIPISLPEAQEEEALALRSKLLMYRIRERSRVAINPALVEPTLEPRMNQILLPLLSIAPTTETRSAILAYATRMQASIRSDRGGSTEGQLLQIIADEMQPDAKGVLPLQHIVDAFSSRFGADYDRPITNRFLGGILRNRLGLPMYKTNGVIAVSLKDRMRLDVLFNRYGIGESTGTNSG